MLRQKPSSIRAKKTGVYYPPEKSEVPQPVYKGGKKDAHHYEHIGGENDTYLYKENGQEIVFERKILNDNLLKLKTYQDILVDYLPAEAREIFTNIMSQGNRLDKTPLYQVFLDSVSKIFSSPTILPGTVAAYLAGCPVVYQENNLGGCDPRCLSSLPLADKPGSNLCDRSVLVLKDGKITVLQNKDTREAVFLIYDPNFLSLSKENVQMLKTMNIRSFHVLKLQADRTFTPVHTMNLEQLAMAASAKQTSSTTTNGWWIFLIIVLIIILIVAIGYAIWWYRQRGVVHEQVSVPVSYANGSVWR